MSVIIREGQIVPCNNKVIGRTSSGKEYMLFTVLPDRGFDKITVFASDVDTVRNSSLVKIKKIRTASVVSKQNKNGRWMKDFNVYCDLEPQENPNRVYEAFMGGPEAEKKFEEMSEEEEAEFNFFTF